MSKKLITIVLSLVFCFTAYAGGQRYLLRIVNGKQEAIPLKKGEKTIDVIKRIESAKASQYSPSSVTSTIDTIKYYGSDADINTNFGYGSKDIALQWYQAQAGGFVKEIWWRQYTGVGLDSAGTVRGWYVDERLGSLAGSAAKWMGNYLEAGDGDGGVTPYKDKSTDGGIWHGPGGADSLKYGFDPLGTEAPWVAGGQSVGLLRDKWQGLKLDDWGDPFPITINQFFGFTLSNDTPWSKGDPASTEARMELLSAAAQAAPYHSFKWYESGRLSANDKGWWWRPDYEWGMYAVVEYTTDRPAKITGMSALGTTLSTSSREVSATVTDDNPGGGAAGVASAYLKYKISPATTYDSVAMTATGNVYTGSIPGAAAGATVSYYVKATDVGGNPSVSSTRSYKIFAKTTEYLLIYNNAQYSMGNADLIYTASSTNPKFDRWSAPTDGIGELSKLLALYDNVLLADGSYPSKNVYPAVSNWIKTGTADKKKNLFFTSQDYGCFIQSACADTSFAAGTFEHDYLGVDKIGPQDQPPAKGSFRMVPQSDIVTQYLAKFETDSGSTLWYNPSYELSFDAYADANTPAAAPMQGVTVSALFKSGDGNLTMGVKAAGSTHNAVYLGFDPGALDFRSDTALAADADPKYHWVLDAGAVPVSFFKSVTAVKPISEVVPDQFSLNQNYPNPFNPTTTIDYSVPVRSNVEIVVYNMLGQKINTVVNENLEAGQYRATWNGKDSFGKSVASGVYFYSMKAGSFQSVKKMMLMK